METPHVWKPPISWEYKWNIFMGMAYFHGSSLPFSQRSQVGTSPKNGKRWKKPREMVDLTLCVIQGFDEDLGIFVWGDQSNWPGKRWPKTMERSTISLMGTSTIYKWAIFHSYVTNYKRVTNDMLFWFAQVYCGISWYIPILWSSQPCKKSTSQYLW